MQKQNPFITQSIAKAPSHRMEKIAEEIRQILATILLRGDFLRSKKTYGSDIIMRLSFTHVQVSADLQHARVFVLVPEDMRKRALSLLKENAGYFRKILSQKMSTKFIPSLVFLVDDSIDRAQRIEDLLNKTLSV